VALIRSLLADGKALSPAAVKESLQRVGGRAFLRHAGSEAPASTSPAAAPKSPGRTKPRQPHTYDEHFGDKPSAIIDLYEQLHSRIMALGDDIERAFMKQYVGYRIGKRTFCSVIPQKGRLRLVLPLDPAAYAGYSLTRDLSGVGKWGVGDMGVGLDSEDQIDLVASWIEEAARQARTT
jgi:predicted transport protein